MDLNSLLYKSNMDVPKVSTGKYFKACLPLFFGSVLLSCGSQPTPTSSQPANPIADLQIVDCLLPGQVRRLGTSTYLTPRRPVSTTAADCRIRGGEYVEFDQADYKTALSIWMPSAEAGDTESQTNVGEIFERGLGGAPNFEAAAIWYTKAADAGNTRAQFNLGTLYEQGLGVEKNALTALNWYRKAWGLPEDNVVFQSAASKESEILRKELQEQLEEKNSQIELLEKQIQRLEQQAGSNPAAADMQAELESLRNLVDDLQADRVSAQNQITALPIFREPDAILSNASTSSTVTNSAKINFGKYYALVIGNQSYTRMNSLYSPRNDAQKVSTLLEEKYGFSVQTLLDATNVEVMQAINDLNSVLGEEDNLLIYYAGHGSRVQSGEIEDGYWLPVNADPPPNDTFWVSNEFITRHLSRLKAKRVLVVADSCYAGLLSSAPGYLFMGDDQNYTEDYLRYKLENKARLILSSGGDQPVLDNAGGENSVFAKAFLEQLEGNTGIMSGPELFVKVRNQVSQAAKVMDFDQEPEFKAIKGAGHEVGDFFFVPIDA